MAVVRSNRPRPERPRSQDGRTAEVALQAFAQAVGTWTEEASCGPAMRDDVRDALRTAGPVLDPSARREVERMLVQAKAHASAIEVSRRQLQSTLNMVLDLINIEAAHRGPVGDVSPD